MGFKQHHRQRDIQPELRQDKQRRKGKGRYKETSLRVPRKGPPPPPRSCLPAYRRYGVHTATAAHFRCRSHITITQPPLEQQEIQHCNPTGSLLLSTVTLLAHIPVGFIGLFHNRDKNKISVPGCPAAQPTVQYRTVSEVLIPADHGINE